MTTIKPFTIMDTLEYNQINLNQLTETYSNDFYGKYQIKWGNCCVQQTNALNNITGYFMGKTEGNIKDKDLHGHVTAVTVARKYRRQGLARYFMHYFQELCESIGGFYVDLFVRKSNDIAVGMYKKFGYVLY